MTYFVAFGLCSAVLSSFAFLPYIVDTLAGRTQPQRASWLIWTVLSVIAFFTQLDSGASASLWFAGAQVSGTITIFLLSIRFGQGCYLARVDGLVLLAAAIGLGLWFVMDEAGYALAMTISISLLAGTVTVRKAYRSPGTETMITWALSLVASCFALASVPEMSWVLLAYPAYLLTLNAAIVGAMLMGRARTAHKPGFANA